MNWTYQRYPYDAYVLEFSEKYYITLRKPPRQSHFTVRLYKKGPHDEQIYQSMLDTLESDKKAQKQAVEAIRKYFQNIISNAESALADLNQEDETA